MFAFVNDDKRIIFSLSFVTVLVQLADICCYPDDSKVSLISLM